MCCDNFSKTLNRIFFTKNIFYKNFQRGTCFYRSSEGTDRRAKGTVNILEIQIYCHFHNKNFLSLVQFPSQFYSLPEYEESFPRGHTISYQMSNGSRVERAPPPPQVAEPRIPPRIIADQIIEPRNQLIIEERRNNQRYRTIAPPEISIIENGHETFRITVPTGKFQ